MALKDYAKRTSLLPTSTAYYPDHSYIDHPKNYHAWEFYPGCMYIQDGRIHQDDIIALPPLIRDIATELAYSIGADIISPKLLPPANPWLSEPGTLTSQAYEYEFTNLWRGDNIRSESAMTKAEMMDRPAQDNPMFDARNIICCMDQTERSQLPFQFDCPPAGEEEFGLYVRGSPKNQVTHWYTNQHRERLMGSIRVGVSLCAATFNKATTDEIFRTMIENIDAENPSKRTMNLFIDAFLTTLSELSSVHVS